MRIGITGKLLTIVIPLAVLPSLLTGVWAYKTSEEIVTRLLNQAQINLAREIADQIGQDFNTCRAELQVISRVPALTDYHYNRFYGLDAEANISRKQVMEFFVDLRRLCSLYYSISFLDAQGNEVTTVSEDHIPGRSSSHPELPFFNGQMALPHGEIYVSKVTPVAGANRRVVYFALPLYDVWHNLSGAVCLALDIEEVAKRILSHRVGLNGYPIVLDSAGCVLVHPELRYDAPVQESLEAPLIEKLRGESLLRQGQGMVSYYYQGLKVASFVREPNTGWVVVAALPVREFKAHGTVIKKQVFQIILLAVSVILAAGVFLASHFLRPIKRLAVATKVVSEGHLPQEVKVESSDELGALTRSFNQMVENLGQAQADLVKSEKLVSLGRLSAGVAHEIRNPLNAMKGALVLLQRKNPKGSGVDELIDLISEEISRLDRFINEFLSYSRQRPPRPTPLSLNDMIREIISAHAIQAEEKGVQLKMELDRSLPLYPVDAFQMERAIVSIVANSLDAMPDGGTLTISTLWWPGLGGDSQTTGLDLCISDTGKGLTPEQLNSAFDPFFTTKEGGTGFGLPLAWSIIEAHGGKIGIVSVPGQRTVVTISLPRDSVLPNSESNDG